MPIFASGTGGWYPSLAMDPIFHEPAFLEFKTPQECHAHLRLTVAGAKLLLQFHLAEGRPIQSEVETLCLADAQDFATFLSR